MSTYGEWYVKRGRNPEQEDWYRYVYARRWEALGEFLSPPKRGKRVVLDLGSGHGYLERTAPSWARVVQVDLEHSETAGGRVACDVARLPFRSGAADGAHASHVIEHLAEPQELVRELHRALKPGGVLMILTPDIRRYGFGFFVDHTHRHPFTGESLRGILGVSGFEVVRLEYGLFHDTRVEDIARRLTRMPHRVRYEIKKRLGRRWSGELIALARKKA